MRRIIVTLLIGFCMGLTSTQAQTCTQTHFMYAPDGSITPWFQELIKDFLIGTPTIMQKKF